MQLREKNSLRIMEAQRNRRIREHESVEKKKFLTQKHDLMRSVTYLHQMHEHNQMQNAAKQKIFLQMLFLSNFCHHAYEKFKVNCFFARIYLARIPLLNSGGLSCF